jgi:hypothetical protein
VVTIPWRYADYLIYIGFGIALMGFCGQVDEARLIVIGGGGPLMPVWQMMAPFGLIIAVVGIAILGGRWVRQKLAGVR